MEQRGDCYSTCASPTRAGDLVTFLSMGVVGTVVVAYFVHMDTW
jgi:uncharacterized protein (DUF983 family)